MLHKCILQICDVWVRNTTSWQVALHHCKYSEWDKLLASDQLQMVMTEGRAFKGFSEWSIYLILSLSLTKKQFFRRVSCKRWCRGKQQSLNCAILSVRHLMNLLLSVRRLFILALFSSRHSVIRVLLSVQYSINLALLLMFP